MTVDSIGKCVSATAEGHGIEEFESSQFAEPSCECGVEADTVVVQNLTDRAMGDCHDLQQTTFDKTSVEIGVEGHDAPTAFGGIANTDCSCTNLEVYCTTCEPTEVKKAAVRTRYGLRSSANVGAVKGKMAMSREPNCTDTENGGPARADEEVYADDLDGQMSTISCRLDDSLVPRVVTEVVSVQRVSSGGDLFVDGVFCGSPSVMS